MGKAPKKYKDYLEQLNHVTSNYGLKIDCSKAFSLRAFKAYSMYDLINGYQNCLLDQSGKYPETKTLSYILALHHIDRGLQSILFKYSVMAETRLKNIIAHVIAEKFGDRSHLQKDDYEKKSYLDQTHYQSSKSIVKYKVLEKLKNLIQEIQERIDKEIQNRGKNKNSHDSISRMRNHFQPSWYYLCEYKNIPPWILIRNVSFSNTINWYEILPSQQKDQVLSEILNRPSIIEEDKRAMKVSFEIVRLFRNVAAHNLKFIDYKTEQYHFLTPQVSKSPAVNKYGLLSWNGVKRGKGQNDIYAFLIALIHILDDPLSVFFMMSDMLSFFNSLRSDLRNEESPDLIYRVCDDYLLYLDFEDDFLSRLKEAHEKAKQELKSLLSSNDSLTKQN